MAIPFLKKDHLLVGVIFGTLLPCLIVFCYYSFALDSEVDFGEFLTRVKASNQFLTALSSIVLLGNALLFGLFIHFRKVNTAKGVFVPTLLIGLTVLLYKFIG
jgi:hypothetical protein